MQLDKPVYFRYTAANDTMLHQPLREVMDETLGIFHAELFHAKSTVPAGPKAGQPVRYSTRSVATAARVSESPDFEREIEHPVELRLDETPDTLSPFMSKPEVAIPESSAGPKPKKTHTAFPKKS